MNMFRNSTTDDGNDKKTQRVESNSVSTRPVTDQQVATTTAALCVKFGLPENTSLSDLQKYVDQKNQALEQQIKEEQIRTDLAKQSRNTK